MSFIKYNNQWINKLFVTGSSVTGVITEQIVASVVVPANTYRSGDFIMLNSMYEKTSALGIYTQKYYWISGNTASLGGTEIQISTRGMAASNRFTTQDRRLYIRTANGTGSGISLGTEVISSTGAFGSDYNPGASSNLAINWTIESTVFTTIQLTNASDSVNCKYLKIWEW